MSAQLYTDMKICYNMYLALLVTVSLYKPVDSFSLFKALFFIFYL